MIKRILIANRGEIALRIIRACREMGIETVAVYSEADSESLHRKMADRAICIGPASPKESYLYIPGLISAAEITECDAIHPGYGFLSENADFADICKTHQFIFIGPEPKVISLMGDKSKARACVQAAGIPIVPGSKPLNSVDEAVTAAKNIGYPVIIKASGGGGGKGMRIVRNNEEMATSFAIAKNESKLAFNNDEIYIEKFIETARHIEFQIMADSHGNVVHLGERDCSIQRRHQKLVEEAPSVFLTQELRKKMGDMAIKVAKASKYVNAGTIEFIMDENKNFYFMEMNSRVQVEHPVTEMVTSIDIVKEQISIAAGKPLSFKQSDINIKGYAMECRICAEDPALGFMPQVGTISNYIPAGGPFVRTDTHVYSGYQVSPHYDSMIAKIIVWGQTRDESIVRMKRALSEVSFTGINTTIPFFQKLLKHEKFIKGEISTNFIAKMEV
ncbi:MAG: acetyl-CoA carboxylase biotin carboxylase subunit [Candidatus Wallbacteria bacterium]